MAVRATTGLSYQTISLTDLAGTSVSFDTETQVIFEMLEHRSAIVGVADNIRLQTRDKKWKEAHLDIAKGKYSATLKSLLRALEMWLP